MSTQAGWHIADVNEIPPVKPDWPATWKSVRHHFGITAFGINAVTKDAGNVLIPEHDERESGQQEVYFVHRGRLEMEFGDGGSVVLEPGGIVRVDPATVRKLRNTGDEDAVYMVAGGDGGYVGRDGRLPEDARQTAPPTGS